MGSVMFVKLYYIVKKNLFLFVLLLVFGIIVFGVIVS